MTNRKYIVRPKFLRDILAFMVNPNPPKWWLVLRFFIHWVLLPIKLIIIGVTWLIAAIWHNTTTKVRQRVDDKPKIETKHYYIRELIKKQPILRQKGMELYCSRVPIMEAPNGFNHNDDHQGGRHGTYTFLMSRLGMRTSEMDRAIRNHLQPRVGVVRGFKGDSENEGLLKYNMKSTAGDQLIGIALSMLYCTDPQTKDRYEQSITAIINNDYSILEGYEQEPMDAWAVDEWYKQLTLNGGDAKLIKMKSPRGDFAPGILPVGAQALTGLAAIRVAAVKCRSPYAKEYYNKLLWKYGYGLLSLFPTAFIPGASSRGYFNDHNTLVSAYILAKLSGSFLGKLYWSIVMWNIWIMSKKWYNGYFSGLLKDVAPWMVSDKHIEKCKEFLYEEEPRTDALDYHKSAKELKPDDGYPVRYNRMNRGAEFHPDEAQVIKEGGSGFSFKNGLGWLAHVIMTDEKTVKDSLIKDY